ncbi:coiled-coil-helix-coiled-coil-helix domain containing 4b [Chanos chanos]|uniref:Coiled-coil-helix-coiled-coil-helix domain containing 4b n=1 Tax=Chanos chanos TaxID=29144 RepID=A0A6J2VP05_CHACN|nr:mitochondrial intermembrane space import and assembly protein 40-like [Chanos chanos]
MSAVNEEGKDQVIFVTKEEHETPSTAELVQDDPDDPYEEKGLILPSGEINWNCPCLGGMASGPCGEQFKAAFTCFHFSQEEVKGSDCLQQFRDMQDCLRRFPELYPQEEEPEPTNGQADPADPAPTEEPTPKSQMDSAPSSVSAPDPTPGEEPAAPETHTSSTDIPAAS